MSNQFDEGVIEAKRAMLKNVLSQINDKQRDNFWRIFKSAGCHEIEDIPEERLKGAYGLCERTIKSNKKQEVKNGS